MKTLPLFLIALTILQSCCDKNQSGNSEFASSQTAKSDSTKTNTSFTSGYADVNGIKMYYEIYGSGKPLVMLHGGGSTIGTSFGRIIPILSQQYQLIGIELQAHGHTGDRNADLSFEQDADDVAALLKTLNIEKADILGFSNGGTTALHLAVRHPESCGKVVAASPLLKRNGAPPQFWEFMKRGTIDQMPKPYTDAYLSITKDTLRYQNMFHKCAKRMLEFKDMSDAQIKSIKAPVLLLNGDADVATTEHIVQMSKLIPNCKLAIIPGGHGEYMGEISTLKPGKESKLEMMAILEKFLE